MSKLARLTVGCHPNTSIRSWHLYNKTAEFAASLGASSSPSAPTPPSAFTDGNAIFLHQASNQIPGAQYAGSETGNALQDAQLGATAGLGYGVDDTGDAFLRFPGVTGNYATTPDAAALDITGDIDIRAHVAPDSWTDQQAFGGKWISAGGQESYFLRLESSGVLRLFWSTDGVTNSTADSTVAVPGTDGEPLHVRVTLDVDNGASGYDVTFYTSTDGSSWTQLGATVTGGATTSIFASTTDLKVGAYSSGGGTDTVLGRIYSFSVRDGIDGTVVAQFDAADVTDLTTGATFTGTVDGLVYTVTNAGADSNDPLFLDHDGTDYVYLPGANGNHPQTPRTAAMEVTGDIDLRAHLKLDDWTPAADSSVLTKWHSSGGTGFAFRLLSTGALRIYWSYASGFKNNISSAAVPFSDGDEGHVRVTIDVDNGASGSDVTFYTSTDGSSWTQLGTVQTSAGADDIAHNASAHLEIGSQQNGTAAKLTGKVYSASVRDGIDGTVVAEFDADAGTIASDHSTITNGSDVWTVNRSASGRVTTVVDEAKYLLGTDDYLSIPDATALDVASGEEQSIMVVLREHVAASGDQIISKQSATAGWAIDYNGANIEFTLSDGTNTDTISAAAPSAGEKTVVIARVSSTHINLRVNGTDATAVSRTAVDASTADAVQIGRQSAGTSYLDGEIIAAMVYADELTTGEMDSIDTHYGV